MLSPFLKRRKDRRRDRGYVLLFLLLIVAGMAIAAATVVTSIKFEIRRDREEEMIHRGVQYTRAIRAYYRKFNRFPAKIEDLESTNQLRFLRKRYKDPLTGKDFKLVHFGEVKLSGSMGMGDGTIPGANTVGANGQLTSVNGQASGFGTNGVGNSGFGGNSAFGASNSGFGQNSSSGFGQNSNSTFGQNQQAAAPAAGSDASQAAGQNVGSDTTQTPGQNTNNDAQGPQPGSPNGNGAGAQGPVNPQVFGGAPIVGVASTSKDKTIREFDKKKKYNEWMFVYDPMLDRGGLIKTPYQPQLMMQAAMGQGMQNMNGQNPGQNGMSGMGNSGFGNSGGFNSGFSNSPGGMQNNPTSPVGYGNPSQPQPSQPPQQQ